MNNTQFSLNARQTLSQQPKKDFLKSSNMEETGVLILTFEDDIPVAELKQCIALALTYLRNKKLETPARWRLVEKIK